MTIIRDASLGEATIPTWMMSGLTPWNLELDADNVNGSPIFDEDKYGSMGSDDKDER